jgi:hypothetical protein
LVPRGEDSKVCAPGFRLPRPSFGFPRSVSPPDSFLIVCSSIRSQNRGAAPEISFLACVSSGSGNPARRFGPPAKPGSFRFRPPRARGEEISFRSWSSDLPLSSGEIFGYRSVGSIPAADQVLFTRTPGRSWISCTSAFFLRRLASVLHSVCLLYCYAQTKGARARSFFFRIRFSSARAKASDSLVQPGFWFLG